MKAITFGSNGQDGHFLSQLLYTHGVESVEVSRSNADVIGDVGNHTFVEEIIKKHKPDFVFHFAANSTTRHDSLFENHHSISTGTLNILESIRNHSPKTKIFLSGSALQFQNTGKPIHETDPFEANNPYAVARIQSIYAARYFRAAFGLKTYVGYFFNHDSEFRSERHVNQKIVKAVKRISNGSNEKLELGNIDVRKEFNYAGDAMNAIWTLVNQEQKFEAVIGCGTAYSIKDWADYCFSRIGKDAANFITIQKNFTPEYQILVSNPSTIKSLNWEPKLNFQKLADLMLEKA